MTLKTPPDWKTSSLAELGVEAKPGFASGKHQRTSSGVLHLRPMNVTRRGTVSLDDAKFVHDDSERRVRAGDVLFNNTNS